MSETVQLKAITAIVPARDMKRSFRFYQALGFDVEPYEDGANYAFLRLGNSYIHLRRASEKEFTYNPGGLYLYVEDVDGFYARVIANGIKTLGPPGDQQWKMREFALSDPDELLDPCGTAAGLRVNFRSGEMNVRRTAPESGRPLNKTS